MNLKGSQTGEVPSLDRAVSLRHHVMATAMHSFGAWGYQEIQVPMLHFFDALKPGLDADQIERAFRFVDRAGNIMVLRPDVTPVVAQTLVGQNQLRPAQLPLRVSYTHKVFHIERSFVSRELESYQVGVERLGGGELVADLEILIIVLEVLGLLGLSEARLSIADHAVAHHLLKATGAPRRTVERVRRAIVARDVDEVRAALRRVGSRAEYVEALSLMASLDSGIDELMAIDKIFPHDRVLRGRLTHLSAITSALDALGFGGRFLVELGELSGASYYTGMAFSILSEGSITELGHGGRYDDLLGLYGKPTPAVGFSFSLEAMIQAIHPGAALTARSAAAEERVAVQPNHPATGFSEAIARRQQGLRAIITQATDE